MSATEMKQYPLCLHLTAREMQKSIAFYRDALGFAVRESWPEKDPMFANLVLDKQSVMLGGPCAPEKAAEFGCSEAEIAIMKRDQEAYAKNRPGVGVSVYLLVPDVDAYHARLVSKKVPTLTAPKTQFYGQREFIVEDPDGYRLVFYMPVQMATCQSCAMPLEDAQPGQMYCRYCSDSRGRLKSYDEVFEGTVAGYFMGMQKMSRPDAERAARAHLAQQPAWAGRS